MAEYCMKILFRSSQFIQQYKDIFCKNYDVKILDANKTSIMASKFNILNFKGIHSVYAFSDGRMVYNPLFSFALCCALCA